MEEENNQTKEERTGGKRQRGMVGGCQLMEEGETERREKKKREKQRGEGWKIGEKKRDKIECGKFLGFWGLCSYPILGIGKVFGL